MIILPFPQPHMQLEFMDSTDQLSQPGVSAIGIMVETVAVRAPSGPMEEFLQTCDAPCFVLGQLGD